MTDRRCLPYSPSSSSFSFHFPSLLLLDRAVRPVIVRPPQDATALLGGEVTLECGVTGDPPPHVEWRRQDGAKIPVNRIRPTTSSDQSRTSLRLERLVASDAGRYVCEVENSVGSSSASAQLVILIPVLTFLKINFLNINSLLMFFPQKYGSPLGTVAPESVAAGRRFCRGKSADFWIRASFSTAQFTALRRHSSFGSAKDKAAVADRLSRNCLRTTRPVPVAGGTCSATELWSSADCGAKTPAACGAEPSAKRAA